MAEKELREAWARTDAHLETAQRALGTSVEGALTEVREFRAHNELGLAFVALVDLADEHRAGRECWVGLQLAASEMALEQADPVHGPALGRVVQRLADPS